MKVVSYDPKYEQDFIDMNRLWISEMFVLEAEDLAILEHVEERLVRGGQIYFAVDGADVPMACCMIEPIGPGEWEVVKFCARGMYTGTGAGSACLQACIDHARAQGAQKISIVSNRRCVHAVGLYRKFGFTEVPVDKEKFGFERADIAFEMVL